MPDLSESAGDQAADGIVPAGTRSLALPQAFLGAGLPGSSARGQL